MNWWMPSAPSALKPKLWLSPAACEYMESIITPDMTVMEFGGGGSTLWFAQRVKQVITYEPDAEWYVRLSEKAPANVTLRNATIWNLSDTCDLLFIDGEPVIYRGMWLAISPLFCKKYVVLDNANRPEYVEQRTIFKDTAHLEKRVNGNEGNTLYLVTEFWRMK